MFVTMDTLFNDQMQLVVLVKTTFQLVLLLWLSLAFLALKCWVSLPSPDLGYKELAVAPKCKMNCLCRHCVCMHSMPI